MNEQTVAIINKSVMGIGAFRKLVAALTFQLERDYNTSPWVKCGYAPKANVVTGEPPEGAYVLTLQDHGAGNLALGWHEQAPDGSIVGFCNYGATHAAGLVAETMSHELFEMLVDPTGDFVVTDPDSGNLYRAEIADPVYGAPYELMGMWVSDFVEPAWFGLDDGLDFPWYSHQNTIAAPHVLGPHGYCELQNAGEPGVWHTIVHSTAYFGRPITVQALADAAAPPRELVKP